MASSIVFLMAGNTTKILLLYFNKLTVKFRMKASRYSQIW